MKQEITKNLLNKLYHKDNLTMRQIAKYTGWGYSYIGRKFKEFDIRIKNKREQWQL